MMKTVVLTVLLILFINLSIQWENDDTEDWEDDIESEKTKLFNKFKEEQSQYPNPVEFPKNLKRYIERDPENENRFFIKQQFLLPSLPKKVEMDLSIPEAPVSLRGHIKSFVKVRADTSINGKLTATFGFMDYDLKDILNEKSNVFIIFFTDVRSIKQYKQDFGSDAPPATVFLDLEFSTNTDDLTDMFQELEEAKKTGQTVTT
eukprot:TRINITY_DN741_c0_g1_i1.p1 TRINITY_DN741_c0_g1~~TRINITY_DN741_c0_g1_i1.p1  ORF type:complete len:204 (+),score=71.39 TRINITY_DN741_c0_g1_i1:54-665(+)